MHQQGLERRVRKAVGEWPSRPRRADGIERSRNVARGRGRDAGRSISGLAVVGRELDVEVVQVLVEEEVQPDLQVAAVGGVHRVVAGGELSRGETGRVAARRLE